MAYKFYNVDLFYTEAGITLRKDFCKNFIKPDIKLGIRYFATHGTYRLSELDVVIFFPDYKDKGEQRVWDSNGMLFLPEFVLPCNIGSVKVKFSLDGVFPLVFKNKGHNGSNNKETPITGSKTGKFIGGINATTTISIPVFRGKS
jgi:hypothetical protein